MKRTIIATGILVLLLAFCGLSAVFPTAVATDADLLVARNSATSTLNGAINASVTTFNLVSGTRFGNNMVVTIDSEIIFCTTLSTNTFSGCSRGYNGSTAASHSNGATVSGFLIAAHHNSLSDEIKAIETALGANLGNIFACTSTPVTCTIYDSTATTGITRLKIRPGAGQSSNAYALFYQDSAGTVVSSQFDGLGAFSNFKLSPNVKKIAAYDGSFLMASDVGANWRSVNDLDSAGSYDTGLYRNAAGVVEVNNGTSGTIRDFKLRTLKRAVLTVATLPGTPADGDSVWITDSADGSCVAGSGSIRVNCVYNGTGWIAH